MEQHPLGDHGVSQLDGCGVQNHHVNPVRFQRDSQGMREVRAEGKRVLAAFDEHPEIIVAVRAGFPVNLRAKEIGHADGRKFSSRAFQPFEY